MKKHEKIESQNIDKNIGEAAATTEVVERPARRVFAADYKLRILDEIDACEFGQVGALLRREGLYSSHLETWRRQRTSGELAGLAPKKRGRKPADVNPLQAEVERLRRQTARLEERLRQAEAIITVQKKVSELLGLSTPTAEI